MQANYQSLEFDVELEVDLDGDSLINPETERHMEHFKLVKCLWKTVVVLSGAVSII